MNKEKMIKQAYVRGLAARGILRMRAMQKQALLADQPGLPPGGLNVPHFGARFGRPADADLGFAMANMGLPNILDRYNGPIDSGKKKLSRLATDALAGAGGAGIGAIIGALVAYARKKKILGHALAGAGIGGLAGVGGNELYRYLSKKPETSEDDLDLGAAQRDAGISEILNNPLPDEPLGQKLDARAFRDFSGLA